MNGKKLIICLICILLLSTIGVVSSRGRSFFEISGTEPKDVISVELKGYGKSIYTEDGSQVQELVNILNGIEFSQTLRNGTGIPGGTSVLMILSFGDGKIERVTMPYCSYMGRSFITSEKVISYFDLWFE